MKRFAREWTRINANEELFHARDKNLAKKGFDACGGKISVGWFFEGEG